MLWINLLHLYQPANIEAATIKKASVESYWRLIRALEEHPNAHFTFNITGCLFLRWEELGYKDIPKRLAELMDNGQLEITGSAAYHPILPLVPEEEAIWQIKTNEKILKKFFGKNFKPKGFFLPEMAYSQNISKLIKKFGYKWLVLDEFSAGQNNKNFDSTKIYIDGASGIKVIFRSRKLSNSYVPDTIVKMSKGSGNNNIAITATDAELYGLRHNDPTAILEKSLDDNNIKTLTFSEYIGMNKAAGKINLINSTWETSEQDLKNKTPYPLWYDKKNTIQASLWDLANFSYKVVEKNKKDANYDWARWHLVRGLASCTFWWASRKDFRTVFGPISWSPDEIERGVNELVRAVRSLENPSTRKDKLKVEDKFVKIKKLVWDKHWTSYWKK